MMLQLNPMIPVYVPEFNMEGYAFIVTDYGIENYKFYSVALDNGEIWELDNRRIRFCVNHTAGRSSINKEMKSDFVDRLKK